MSLILDEHRQYLEDKHRLTAFDKAVREVVRPGDVVLDLGCGTGILGLLACRAGASKVYSVDSGDLVGLAREISKANGFQDRTTFVKGLSTQIDLPEQFDVVLSDQIGHFGFNAGLLNYYSDARRRFLKPGGRLIPSRIDLFVTPVECEEYFAQIDFWRGSPGGFDFGPARTIAANTGYPVKFGASQLLASPALGVSLDLHTAGAGEFHLEASSVIERPGTLHGIGGWFKAQLSPSVMMTTSPLTTDAIARRHIFFPIDRPVAVSEGDRIRIGMHILPADLIVTWKVEVIPNGKEQPAPGQVFSHSTWKGMLMSQESLRRTAPGFVPQLTERGVARLTVLQLCDGRRPLGEIEEEVYRRHTGLFSSPQEAALFVAEVVTGYSK